MDEVRVPFHGVEFPDGWTTFVRELVAMIAAEDPAGAAATISASFPSIGADVAGEIMHLGGLLVGALHGLWGCETGEEFADIYAEVRGAILVALDAGME